MRDSLKKFPYLGFECEVVNNGMGFRCGYVTVPVGHPAIDLYHEGDYEIENTIDCHGGVTYTQLNDDGTLTIGFDCAHYNDAPDPRLKGYNPQFASHIRGVVRSTEYCVQQCMKMAEQLKLMEVKS